MIQIIRAIILIAFLLYFLWLVYPEVIKFFPYRPDDKQDKREVL